MRSTMHTYRPKCAQTQTLSHKKITTATGDCSNRKTIFAIVFFSFAISSLSYDFQVWCTLNIERCTLKITHTAHTLSNALRSNTLIVLRFTNKLFFIDREQRQERMKKKNSQKVHSPGECTQDEKRESVIMIIL